jgi:hypothetical protein
MNKFKAAVFKPQWIISLIVFIVVLVLGYMYRNALQDTVLVSFQYLLWVGNIFIRNLDQRILWLQILIVSLVLAYRFSRLFNMPFAKRRRHIPDEAPPASGRIDFWQYRVYMYRSVRSNGNFFLLDFPRLIIETLAFHERSDPDTIKQGIISGDIQVPAEVYSMVAMDDLPTELEQDTSTFQHIRNLIQLNSGRSKKPEMAADTRLEEVAAYLEKLLEDENDH